MKSQLYMNVAKENDNTAITYYGPSFALLLPIFIKMYGNVLMSCKTRLSKICPEFYKRA